MSFLGKHANMVLNYKNDNVIEILYNQIDIFHHRRRLLILAGGGGLKLEMKNNYIPISLNYQL